MKNFCPHITIWSIELRDRASGILAGQEFFLSYRRASKYLEKHQKEWEDYEICLGGEPLWLW